MRCHPIPPARKPISLQIRKPDHILLLAIEYDVPAPINPCVPSPCGPNSECRQIGDSPSCSCLLNYLGTPPNCRPECSINSECPSNLACIRERCRDPCPGSCGLNAHCSVINHIPICSCLDEYTGDPFSNCYPKPPRKLYFLFSTTLGTKPYFSAQEIKVDPCNPSPCGANALCSDGVCTCLAEYQGDPYKGCRPECILNNDCPRDKACISKKCKDPCPGTCGQNAECNVVNHIPMCACPSGYTGNAFVLCKPVESRFMESHQLLILLNPFIS